MTTEVVKTHNIAARVIDIVSDARKRVVLVTPYIKTWGHLDEAFRGAQRRGVDSTLLFRADKLEEYKDLVKQLHGFGIRIGTIRNLHAKVYANESGCLLTSMNLYDVSAQNNEEFALYTNEPDLLRATMEYANDLLAKADVIKPESKAVAVFKSVAGAAAQSVGKAAAGAVGSVIAAMQPGSCIRCGTDMPYNPDKPMCAGCYSAWSKYKNPEYPEKFCHDCGKAHKSSMLKPVCLSCYKRAR
ncbi:hypothetical protein IT575_13735 [bacterium]|nr:hypothetical protein [bacterium]